MVPQSLPWVAYNTNIAKDNAIALEISVVKCLFGNKLQAPRCPKLLKAWIKTMAEQITVNLHTKRVYHKGTWEVRERIKKWVLTNECNIFSQANTLCYLLSTMLHWCFRQIIFHTALLDIWFGDSSLVICQMAHWIFYI